MTAQVAIGVLTRAAAAACRRPQLSAVAAILLPVALLLGCQSAARTEAAATAPDRDAPEWVTAEVRAPRVRQVIFESAAARTRASYHICEVGTPHPMLAA